MKNILIYSSNILFILILITNISFTKADLPVHCLVSDVVGEWVIRINKEQFDARPEDMKTTCQHGLPDQIDKTVGDHSYSWDAYHDLTLTLQENMKVKEAGQEVGTWTQIYDQSFLIHYKNSILTAPYMYYLGNDGEYKSNCKKTMIGWYTPNKDENTKNWSCFFAFRKDAVSSRSFLQLETKTITNEKSLSFAEVQKINNLHDSLKYERLEHMVNEINFAGLSWTAAVHDEFKGLNLNQLKSHLGMRSKQFSNYDPLNLKKNQYLFRDTNKLTRGMNFIQIDKKAGVDEELEEFFKKLDNQEKNVNKLENELKTSTTARVQPKIDVESSDNMGPITYSSAPPATPVTNVIDSETNAGVTAASDSKRDQDSVHVKDYLEIIKHLHKPLDQIDEATLPKNWDWRNVGGVNYVPTVKRQGNCGSCYVFSTVTCLESRLRIQTNNKDQTEFSKQYPLSCNFYSEGCDGGYPYLVGKFFNEFQLVPESCFPYKQFNDKCSNVCDYTKYDKKYKVSQYGYLGGYYGATNEILMMKELRARGPIPGNIRVPITFNYYKSGIYSEKQLKRNSDRLSAVTMVDRHLSWEKVEHSITLVGYGEEKGIKYWIGMNTWGDNWGERGFFKILRGENDCSVESMGDFIQIEVTDR